MSKQADTPGLFTPGPWYASGNGVHIRKGTVGLCVATSHDPNEPGRSTDVCHANARLIAAAPDLLTACEQAVRILDGADSDEGLRVILESAKAAVTKARGTTP